MMDSIRPSQDGSSSQRHRGRESSSIREVKFSSKGAFAKKQAAE